MCLTKKWYRNNITKNLLLGGLLYMFIAGILLAANPLTEDQAIGLLQSKIKKDHLYSPMHIACISFSIEDQQPKYFEIALREKHGGSCPGDPDTAPILDRFRVNSETGAISWYSAIEDDYEPYSDFLRERMK